MSRRVDTILIDYDGTLMDTNQLIHHSWEYLFEQVADRIPTKEEIYSTYGEMMHVTLKRFFGGTEEDLRRYVEIYRNYQLLHYDEGIRLFPGVAEMLKQLRRRGYTLCLVTSRTRDSAMEGLQQFGIAEYFDDFVTAEDTDAHKPDPAPVLAALRKLGKEPEQAVMLGDTWFDMECARRAGVSPILVGWSEAYWYRKDRTTGKPDHIIRKPSDLADLMAKINQKEMD